MTNKINFNAVDVTAKRIYDAEIIDDLVKIILPHKRATHLRAAFILIIASINDSADERIVWDEVSQFQDALFRKGRISETLDQATLCKARKHLRRRGIIELRGGAWRKSQRFSRSLEVLAKKSKNFLRKGSQAKQETFLDALNRAFAQIEYNKKVKNHENMWK